MNFFERDGIKQRNLDDKFFQVEYNPALRWLYRAFPHSAGCINGWRYGG